MSLKEASMLTSLNTYQKHKYFSFTSKMVNIHYVVINTFSDIKWPLKGQLTYNYDSILFNL